MVLLNGPRHFLMDSVTATPGRVRSFHGEKMRRVATIPIHSAADLARTPYTDRVVKRRNTWTWNRGRVVYELVAPGGDVYVMQAYAQIVDPKQRIGKLRSLGSRLDLPPGWRYRVRRLHAELDVKPIKGNATIVQDELQNTYQLYKSTRRAGPRKRRAVSLAGRTTHGRAGHARNHPGRGHRHEHAVRCAGRSSCVGSLANGRFTGTFRLLFTKGSVFGTADLPFTIAGNAIDFRGTVRFTAGTGAYRGISSGALQAHDTQHARRPERRDLGRGLRDLLAARRQGLGRAGWSVPLSAHACSSTCRSRSSSCSAALVRPRPVCLPTRLSASSGSLSRS